MQKQFGLAPILIAIAIVAPLAILAFYYILHIFHRATYGGLVIGVLGAAALAFYFIKRRAGYVVASMGTLGIAAFVLYTSMLLLLNIFGA